MIQLYFLSILCNAISGYVLLTENDNMTGDKPSFSISNPVFYLVLGIVSAVVGILKLLSPTYNLDYTKGVFFLGDLLPAAAGIIAALMLIFGIYRNDNSAKSGELERIGVNLLVFRKPIGIALLAVALVHFLFGQLLFL